MDWKITAQRLKELREENKLSYERLSQQLTEKYPHFSLSDQSLLKYEVTEDKHKYSGAAASMKAENLWYFADFYDVSVDYLLGRSDCRKINCEEVLEKTGLSEKAIIQLCDRKAANIPNDTLLYGLSLLLENEIKSNSFSRWNKTLNYITNFLFLSYRNRSFLCVDNNSIYVEKDWEKAYKTNIDAFEYETVLSHLYMERIRENLEQLRKNFQETKAYWNFKESLTISERVDSKNDK